VLSRNSELVAQVADSHAAMNEVQDEDGLTPLHKAVLNQDHESIRALNNSTFNPKKVIIKEGDGKSPLHVAVEMCDEQSVKILFDHFCDVVDSFNNTPLHYVLLNYGRNDVDFDACSRLFKFMIESDKIDVNVVNAYGETVLHIACGYGLVDFVEDLCDKGADVTIPNNDGLQPLHLAVIQDSVECCEILIKHGAPVDGI